MAKERASVKEAQSPLKGQFPNRKEIVCKDCTFRDKTTVTIGNKEIPVGVTKSFCGKYESPPKSNGKPHEVLFENGSCEHYQREE